MRYILLVYITTSISLTAFSQTKLGIINDPDGYTNLRNIPSNKSEIVAKIIEGEFFYFRPTQDNWWFIKRCDGTEGYMHKSRIKEIDNYSKDGKVYPLKDYEIDFETINKKGYYIRITKIDNLNYDKYSNGNDWFYSRNWIEVFKDFKEVNELYFSNIESVGGDAGVYHTEYQLKDKTILLKFGDYEGLLMIVDLNGNITKHLGGDFFITNDQKYIISPWHSDLPGLSVIDNNTNELLFEKETEYYFHEWYLVDSSYYIYGEHVSNDSKKILVLDFEKKEVEINNYQNLEYYKKYQISDWIRKKK